ncbi:MAG: bifunctional phosphopantothenoylcysteine decarboxylase/phosphopantothenate--cysteine ligase CoaBC, partial [Mogibacterium sp.]|nr:bifunctional phosphopantothenoylcysteine decarboxylase/phosphopantothenate--cysteine ligase CoaBC [Mogibacterium sp.]
VLLGISGGISAYKSVYIASGLKKKGYDVHVVMTENATKFVTPLTFETMSGNRCTVDTFDRNFEYDVKHISLARAADLVLIAPATANTIAKLAHGIADDMLTTTVLACTCPKLISPAMNTAMYENPATQDNLDILRDYGFQIIEPAEGMLACGVEGKGKMPEPDVLIGWVEQMISKEKDMTGLKVLVTAGPTEEAVDPVRFITNHSSGKMGYALARMAARRGADVTLVSGRTALPREPFVETVDILSAQDMFEAVTERAPQMDIIIKAAAVADFTPANPADEKIKKADLIGKPAGTGLDGESGSRGMSIDLAPTQDILKYLGEHRREGQFLCGFAMETQNLLENAAAKLDKKNVDMICANSLRTKGAGFAGDTNIVTLITKDGIKELPLMSKLEAADAILDEIMRRR